MDRVTDDSAECQDFARRYAESAAVIDAAVPTRIDTVDFGLRPWPRGGMDMRVAPDRFEYVVDPTDGFDTDRKYEADPQFQYHPTVFDVMSPTAAARTVVWKATKFATSAGLSDLPTVAGALSVLPRK